MKKYAYIFVNRNMGNGYAYAYPPMNPWRSWLLRTFILLGGDAALAIKEEHIAINHQEYERALAQGIFAFAGKFGHTVYTLKIIPDTCCPDPKAKGRSPRFVMHVVMNGVPEVMSKRFNLFMDECRKIALDTFTAGANSSLLREVPKTLYPPRR